MSNKEVPILIDEEPIVVNKMPRKPTNFGKGKPKVQKKRNWGRLITYDMTKTTEKIRFLLTFIVFGVLCFFAADIFRLVHFKSTVGILVFVGVISILTAIAIPIIQLIKENIE